MKNQNRIIISLFLLISIIWLSPDCEAAQCLIACEADESGQINIVDTVSSSDSQVTVLVEINIAAEKVDAMGFDVEFNSECLSYSGYAAGALTGEFTRFACNGLSAGVVRCGGLDTGAGIAQFTSGSIAELTFTVTAAGLNVPDEAVKLDLNNFVDDISGWTSSSGYICGGNCECDINASTDVTPLDALCAFQKYLGICPTNCGPCGDVCCDVTSNLDCSPADALEVFKEYLGIESVCSSE